MLLHLGPNVITFRTLLHLGPNVITFRTLLHLGKLLHLGLQHLFRCYLPIHSSCLLPGLHSFYFMLEQSAITRDSSRLRLILK